MISDPGGAIPGHGKEEPVKEAQIISDNLSFQIRNPLFQSDQTDIVTASATRAAFHPLLRALFLFEGPHIRLACGASIDPRSSAAR